MTRSPEQKTSAAPGAADEQMLNGLTRAETDATASVRGFVHSAAPSGQVASPASDVRPCPVAGAAPTEQERPLDDRAQAIEQCRAVAHMARSLAQVHEARALILQRVDDAPVEIIGESSAEIMERLGDTLSNMDAVDGAEDAWLDPVFERAQERWPSGGSHYVDAACPQGAASPLEAALAAPTHEAQPDGQEPVCTPPPAAAGMPQPVDMVLFCPKCGMQHIDAPESHRVMVEGVHVDDAVLWDNPPHRSHLCHGCGHIWRPADVATNGVAAVKTKGSKDSPLATPPTPASEVAQDAARMDWLEQQQDVCWQSEAGKWSGCDGLSLREAIDAAMDQGERHGD
jgi:hypothetical protein